ncbi:hypothetical protein [Okeania sp. KiyG1]|uniref:hypothetical protein n=1 Tax=Okeania sp. KiyG1 TaxID=2720165 RepID=UPI001923D9D1|nr:hypothetical protein [Okeania sp. KiyG1]GGA11664.1 hypothetical protein CYANOKiyG1_24690 [Okeania sp. KiyG1]
MQIKPIQKGYFCSYGSVTEANNKLEVWGTVPGALKSHLISVFPKHEDQKVMNIAYIFSQLCLRTCPNYWDENITDLSISHQLEKIYNNCTNGNKELPDDINLSTWGSYYDLAHTNPLTKSCSELILKGNP